jgi:Bacterial regulatory proteins, luxR family
MQLTDTQHRILVALCGPGRGKSGFAPPATNQEIADQVFLSVDAVKAHLRTLYRKFGIEDLPQNQKRARLVELVVEGGFLDGDGVEGASTGARPAATPGTPMDAPTPVPPAGPERDSRRAWKLILAALGLAAAAVAILALLGAFDGGGSETTGVAAYREAVSGYCRLALAGAEPNPAGGAQGRARSYLEVIETVRGRVDSLPPPSGSDRSLERFRSGLTNAANYTTVVAEGPPAQGSREQASVVAELTFAAGQVQAGALGYKLGPGCVAIGDLVTRSARNAAHLP